MLELLTLPLQDSKAITKLRRQTVAAPGDEQSRIALGFELALAGCTYEAANILRPLRSRWKESRFGPSAREAIALQAWWSGHWKQLISLKRTRQYDAVKALIGDRSSRLWDLPPFLIHLGEILADEDEFDIADHLFNRVHYLSQRGLPKMNMNAFAYVSQAALIDVLCRKKDFAAALHQHRELVPNAGNAMAHEILRARLLVFAGRHDEAMQTMASIITIGRQFRSGYSRRLQEQFVAKSTELDPLRERADWQQMVQDPRAYLSNPRRRRSLSSTTAKRRSRR